MPKLFRYNPRQHRSVDFLGYIGTEKPFNQNVSGSLEFGVFDDSGAPVLTQTLTEASIVPQLHSGSLNLVGSSLVENNAYEVNLRLSNEYTVLEQFNLDLAMDQAHVSGSIGGEDVYGNAAGNGPNDPDFYMFAHRAAGTGHDDEHAWHKYDYGNDRWEVNKDFATWGDLRLGAVAGYDLTRSIYWFADSSETGAYVRFVDSGGFGDYFELSHDLNMSDGRVFNVADPTLAQDAVNLQTLDARVSGSFTTPTLQTVTDAGNTTTNSITGNDLNANGSVYIDKDGTAGTLDFGNGTTTIVSSTTQLYLQNNDFQVAGQVRTTRSNDIKSGGNLYMWRQGHDSEGIDGDAYLYVWDGGTDNGQYLKWANALGRWEFSAQAYVPTNLLVGATQLSYVSAQTSLNINDELTVGSDTTRRGQLTINKNSNTVVDTGDVTGTEPMMSLTNFSTTDNAGIILNFTHRSSGTAFAGLISRAPSANNSTLSFYTEQSNAIAERFRIGTSGSLFFGNVDLVDNDIVNAGTLYTSAVQATTYTGSGYILTSGNITSSTGNLDIGGNGDFGGVVTVEASGSAIASLHTTGDSRIDGEQIHTPHSQTLTSGLTDVIQTDGKHFIKVTGSITMLATPCIAPGVEGQEILLLKTDTGTLTIPDETFNAGSGVRLSANIRALGQRDSLRLLFDGTDWVEIGFTNAL